VVAFTLTVDPDIMPAYADLLEDAPKTIDTFIGKTIVDQVQNEVNLVDQYPGPVAQPIEWANPIPTPPGKISNILGGLWSRQKAAYFASDGFGAGIPYQRKGTFWNPVTVDWDPIAGTLTVLHPNPIAIFVIEMFQQKFHANTGWPLVEEEYLNIVIRAQDNLIEGYFSIVDVKSLI
jgi:hypothetical protein